MRNQVSGQASSWQHLMQKSFKVEEWNVSIRWSFLGQPIDCEHGDGSYVLSGGLMLGGCPSTSGERQSVNPPHYGWWGWHCLIIVWWSTTSFRSDSNQNLCLANPELSLLSNYIVSKIVGHPWISACSNTKFWYCCYCVHVISVRVYGIHVIQLPMFCRVDHGITSGSASLNKGAQMPQEVYQ